MDFLEKKLGNCFSDPMDVYSAMSPLFSVCTVFGLAPYYLNRLEKGKKVFKFAWWPLIRNFLLICLLIGCISYHELFQRQSLKLMDMKGKLRYFQEIVTSLLSCCAVICGSIFATKIIDVFKNIEEVDVSFRTLAIWVPYKWVFELNISKLLLNQQSLDYRVLHTKVVMHLSAMFFMMIGLIVLLICMSHVINDYDSWKLYTLFITFVTIILPHSIGLIMELQYGHYLNILRSRYQLLNEYLETLVDEHTPSEGTFCI